VRNYLFYVSLIGLLITSIACGDGTPPKGDHNEVKPAPIAPAFSNASSGTILAPAPSMSSNPSSISENTVVEKPSVAVDKIVEVLMQDANAEYAFISEDLVFQTGEIIQFDLTSENEFHSFVVDDLGIDVEVDGGNSEQLIFTFDKPGVYTLICIPHETLGMVGEITVN
jgi:plastocyanin